MAGPMTLEINLVLNAAGVKAGGKQAEEVFQGFEGKVKQFSRNVLNSLRRIETGISTLATATKSHGAAAVQSEKAIINVLKQHEQQAQKIGTVEKSVRMSSLAGKKAEIQLAGRIAAMNRLGHEELAVGLQWMKRREVELQNEIQLRRMSGEVIKESMKIEQAALQMSIRYGTTRLKTLSLVNTGEKKAAADRKAIAKTEEEAVAALEKQRISKYNVMQKWITQIHKSETNKRLTAEKAFAAKQRAIAEAQAAQVQRLWHSLLRYTTVGLTFAMVMQRVGDSIVNGLVRPAVASFGEFEAKMVRIGFLLSDYHGSKYREATTFIQRFAADSLFYIDQVQDALTQLLQSGLDFGAAKGAMVAVHNWALLSDQLKDTRSTVRLLVATYNIFRKSTPGLEKLFEASPEKAFSRIGDQLAFMTQKTIFEPKEMGAFIRTMRGMPALLHIPLDEILSVGGAVRSGGMQPADTGHSISTFIQRMTNIEKKVARFGAKDVGDYWKKLGLSPAMIEKAIAASGRDVGKKIRRAMSAQTIGGAMKGMGLEFFDNGKFVGLNEAIKRTITSLGKLESEQAKIILATTLFGQQGLTAVKMVENFKYKTLEGAAALDKFNQDIKRSNGYLQTFAEERLKNFEAKLKLINAVLETINVQIGAVIGDALSPLLDVIKPVLQGIVKFNNEYPMVTKGIVMITTAFGVLALVLGTLGVAFFGFMSMMSLTLFFTNEVSKNGLMPMGMVLQSLRKDLAVITKGMIPFNLTLGQLGLILKFGVLGGLIGAAIYLTNLGGAADWVNEKIKSVRLVFGALQEYFKKGYLSKGTMGALLGYGSDGPNVLGWFEDILHAIRWVKAIGQGVWSGLQRGLEQLEEPLNQIWKVFGAVASLIWSAIEGLLGLGGELRNTDGYLGKVSAAVSDVVYWLSWLIIIPMKAIGVVASLLGWLLKFDAVQWVVVKLVQGYMAWWAWTKLCAIAQWALGKGSLKIATLMLMSLAPVIAVMAALVGGFLLGTYVINKFGDYVDAIILKFRDLRLTIIEALGPLTSIGRAALSLIPGGGALYSALSAANPEQGMSIEMQRKSLEADKRNFAANGTPKGDKWDAMGGSFRQRMLNTLRERFSMGTVDYSEQERLERLRGTGIGLGFTQDPIFSSAEGQYSSGTGTLFDFMGGRQMPLDQASQMNIPASFPGMSSTYSDGDLKKMTETMTASNVQYGATQPKIGQMSVRNDIDIHASYALTPDKMDEIIDRVELKMRQGALGQSLAE